MSSCILGKLGDELEVFEEEFATVEGTLNGAWPNGELAIIALFRVEADDEHLVRYKLEYSPEPFRFIGVKPGSYKLVAFSDRNGDLIYQRGEPACMQEIRFTAVGGGHYSELGLVIDSSRSDFLSGSLDLSDDAEMDFQRCSRGEITTIDDPRFSAENGSIGMWEPVRFMEEVGGGLYMLEAYDPNKIPVLFIHGLGGNPSEFAYMIEQMDRAHFQPWLAFYPTHARMEAVVGFVSDLTEGLFAKYGYEHLYVVGHSMGGLVGLGFVEQLAPDTPYGNSVGLLVTMCAPWGGSAAAEMGLKWSHVVAPAWIDLATGSPFLQGLASKPIPEQIPFHLMFAYLDGEHDDGTVSISSALHAPVQDKAGRVYGYHSKHAAVLTNRAVSDELNQILKTTRESQQ